MYQSADRPRARILFDAREDGRAVIEFFRAADASSAPHELYHIFRREMAESAVRPDAPRYLVDDWKRIEAFVGVEPGKPWTRDMEEKFARAGERFLLEGRAPTAELRGVFERLRQWFLNIYRQMDDAGLHISPAMREVFSRMFAAPARNADNDALRGTLTAGDRRALAAATDAAFPGPIPAVLHICFTDMPERVMRLSPADLSSILEISTALSFLLPVRTIVAISSALLSAPSPFSAIFSRGLSSIPSSLIFIVFSGKYKDDRKRKSRKGFRDHDIFLFL